MKRKYISIIINYLRLCDKLIQSWGKMLNMLEKGIIQHNQ